jgi:hypothetical protein
MLRHMPLGTLTAAQMPLPMTVMRMRTWFLATDTSRRCAIVKDMVLIYAFRSLRTSA